MLINRIKYSRLKIAPALSNILTHHRRSRRGKVELAGGWPSWWLVWLVIYRDTVLLYHVTIDHWRSIVCRLIMHLQQNREQTYIGYRLWHSRFQTFWKPRTNFNFPAYSLQTFKGKSFSINIALCNFAQNHPHRYNMDTIR